MARPAPAGAIRWEAMAIVPRELTPAGRVGFLTVKLNHLKQAMRDSLPVPPHRSVELLRPRVTFIPKATGAMVGDDYVRDGDLLAVLSVPYVRS